MRSQGRPKQVAACGVIHGLEDSLWKTALAKLIRLNILPIKKEKQCIKKADLKIDTKSKILNIKNSEKISGIKARLCDNSKGHHKMEDHIVWSITWRRTACLFSKQSWDSSMLAWKTNKTPWAKQLLWQTWTRTCHMINLHRGANLDPAAEWDAGDLWVGLKQWGLGMRSEAQSTKDHETKWP